MNTMLRSAVLVVMGLVVMNSITVALAEPNSHRKKLLNSVEAVDAAIAYQSMFTEITRENLGLFLEDSNAGIALHAAWELYKNPVSRAEDTQAYTYSRKELSKFSAFLKDRVKVQAPDWWSTALTDLDVFPDHHSSLRTMGQWPQLSESKAGYRVEAGVRLQQNGESLEYTKNGRSVVFPTSTFGQMSPDTYLGLLGEKRSVFAGLSEATGRQYKLACVESSSGKVVWTADVWATGPKHGSGNNRHRVEIMEKDSVIYVFGADACGLYLEAFDIGTGEPCFRFCTCYWSNYSENWTTARK